MKRLKKNIVILILLIAIGIGSYEMIYEKKYIYDVVNYQAQKTYTSDFHICDITLLENGREIGYVIDDHDGSEAEIENGVLFQYTLSEDEKVKSGKIYPEELKLRNDGVWFYIRVVIYKYWMGPDGYKDSSKDLSLIDLHLTNVSENGYEPNDMWLLDTKATVPDRIVLYYNMPTCSKTEEMKETLPFCDSIKIKGEKDENMLAKEIEVNNSNGHKVIETKEEYEGYTAQIEMSIDVTDGNIARLSPSAIEGNFSASWGCSVHIDDDGRLTLL